MPRTTSILFFAALTLALASGTAAGLVSRAGSAPQEGDSEYPWQIEELAPGVYAALQPEDSRFDDANSVFVVGEDGVTVIDAQSSRVAVRALQQEIESRTDRPVRTLVNTHWHADHTMGNALYRDRYGSDLTILGQATLLLDVPGRAAALIDDQRQYFLTELEPARERLAEGVDREGRVMDAETRESAARQIEAAERWLEDNADTRFEAPDTVYDSAWRSTRSGRPIEVIHLPGHTGGDSVVWLPEDRILVAGDLVDALPFVGHGAPARWARTLRAILELDFDVVVPGHGPLYRGRARVETILAYLEDLAFQAREAVTAGRTVDEAIASIDLTGWRERLGEDEAARQFFDQVQGEAIRAAWNEAAGESPGTQ